MEATAHPAPTLRYFLLDVFTERPFSGNQVAVFVDPESLSDGQMQRIAAELRLSETVFVWSPAAHRRALAHSDLHARRRTPIRRPSHGRGGVPPREPRARHRRRRSDSSSSKKASVRSPSRSSSMSTGCPSGQISSSRVIPRPSPPSIRRSSPPSWGSTPPTCTGPSRSRLLRRQPVLDHPRHRAAALARAQIDTSRWDAASPLQPRRTSTWSRR